MLQCDHEFSIRGEVIPVGYQYLECIVEEFLDLNAMVDDEAETGRRALGSCARGLTLLLGCCMAVSYFKKLLHSMVQSVLLYRAEAWGCLRRL